MKSDHLNHLRAILSFLPSWLAEHNKGGMCAIPAGEGKSALFCTEFSEEFGDAPNLVTNSALFFSQC